MIPTPITTTPASFLDRRHNHVRPKFVAFEKGPEVFDRFGNHRSIRSLHRGQTRSTDLLGRNEYLSDRRALFLENCGKPSRQITEQMEFIGRDTEGFRHAR